MTFDTGNTLAAATGATLKELMTRMGHSSTKAATVYLHAAKDRDRAIADAMGEIVKQGLGAKDDDDDPPLIGTMSTDLARIWHASEKQPQQRSRPGSGIIR
jgi:hypothetical protein